MNGSMDHLGRTLVVLGLGIALTGGVLWALSAWAPALRVGRLPGDVSVQREGFSLYMPITTMILVSLALTLIVWLVGAVRR